MMIEKYIPFLFLVTGFLIFFHRSFYNFKFYEESKESPKRSTQYQSASITKSNLDMKIKDSSFLNSATQIDRRKTLFENCPAYLEQTGQKAVDGNSFAKVASAIGRKLTTRYFPRFRAIYCIQHKAGTTNFNRFLNEIKHNSTDRMTLTEVHYGIPFLINSSFDKVFLRDACRFFRFHFF